MQKLVGDGPAGRPRRRLFRERRRGLPARAGRRPLLLLLLLLLRAQLAHKVQQRCVAEHKLVPRLHHAQPLPPAGGEASGQGQARGQGGSQRRQQATAAGSSSGSRRQQQTAAGRRRRRRSSSRQRAAPQLRHELRHVHGGGGRRHVSRAQQAQQAAGHHIKHAEHAGAADAGCRGQGG